MLNCTRRVLLCGPTRCLGLHEGCRRVYTAQVRLRKPIAYVGQQLASRMTVRYYTTQTLVTRMFAHTLEGIIHLEFLALPLRSRLRRLMSLSDKMTVFVRLSVATKFVIRQTRRTLQTSSSTRRTAICCRDNNCTRSVSSAYCDKTLVHETSVFVGSLHQQSTCGFGRQS